MLTDFQDDAPEVGLADSGVTRASDPADAAAAEPAMPADAAPALPPVERELGFILDEPDEEKIARHVIELREDQDAGRSRHRAIWTRNRWWREGRRFIRLDKRQDANQWSVRLPYGMGSAPPVPNKTDRLCRRLTNTMLVDAPYPDCEPGDGSPEAREAAEFATRYLAVLGASASLNMKRICRAASDKSHTYASAFGWVTMDPGAAGHRPRRMLAHPLATTTENALDDPTAGDATGIDALAGVALAANEDDLQERFIRPDGYLTDDPGDADLQWLPSPKVRLLTGLQFSFLPETARGMDDAIGCIIVDITTLGDLRALFPERMARLDQDGVDALCAWRPTHVEDVLPPFTKEPKDQKYEDGPKTGQYKDSQMVVTSTIYYRSSAEYPFGCYAVIGGNTMVLHRQKWSAKMPVAPDADGQERPAVEECLEIPVAQCRCLDDDVYDDPYGIGISEHLGPADEIRASALGFELEHMFRSANPIPFIPIGSIVQPKQFLVRDGTPVMTNPDGKPVWEDVPPLSPTVPLLREEMTHEMDDDTGLQETAQGLEVPSINSGIQAQRTVQEALKALTGMKDNLGDFYIAVNRIILEQSRAYCTVPQLLSYIGDDGAYKAKEWARTDFRTTKRVSIAKGSFTMHTLLAKQEMAQQMKQVGAIDNEDYVDLMAGGVSPVLGMQDNPFLMRVRRQIELYLLGPPPGWLEAFAQVERQNQQQQQLFQQQQALFPEAQQEAAGLQASGVPVPSPAAPVAPQPIPPPPSPFTERLPVDLEPMPAKIRHRQMGHTMASSRYEALAPQWKVDFLREYADMANAAGIMTVPALQAAKAQELANQPPALPKGVSIVMKADQSNVAEEEQAALSGFGKGPGAAPGVAPGAGGQSPAPPTAPGGGSPAAPAAPASQSPVINIHNHMPAPHGFKTTVQRDEKGQVIGSDHAPVMQGAPGGEQ